MTPSRRRMTPLRRRMVDDMTLRNLSPKTIGSYVQRVSGLVSGTPYLIPGRASATWSELAMVSPRRGEEAHAGFTTVVLCGLT
jgi:hypothetical protein